MERGFGAAAPGSHSRQVAVVLQIVPRMRNAYPRPRRPLALGLLLLAACGGTPPEASEASAEPLLGGLVFTDEMWPIGRFGDVDLDGREDFEVRIRPTFGVVGPRPQRSVLGVTAAGLYASWLVHEDPTIDSRPLMGEYVGDLTGDGRADFFQSDDVGWRLYSLVPTGGVVTHWRYGTGNVIDGVTLTPYAMATTADLDGDGKKELVLKTAEGYAFFRVDGSGLRLYNQISNGQRLAGDRMNLSSDCYTYAGGHFWGGSTDLLLMRCSAGWALLYVLDRAYLPGDAYAIHFAPMGEMQVGGWRLGYDLVQGVGDFNGDGQDDFVVRSAWGLAVLTAADWSQPTSFRTIGAIQWNATLVDGASLAATIDGRVAVGDFDGDHHPEILIRDNVTQRLVDVVMSPTGALVGRYTLQPGQLAGGWRYGGEAVFTGLVGKFGRADRDSIVLRSPWGVGVIGVGEAGFMSYGASPYEVITLAPPPTTTTPPPPPPPPAPETIWTVMNKSSDTLPEQWTLNVAGSLGSKKITKLQIVDAHPLSVDAYFSVGFVPKGHDPAYCYVDAAVIWVDEGQSLSATQLATLVGTSSPTLWSGLRLTGCALSKTPAYLVPTSFSVAATLVP